MGMYDTVDFCCPNCGRSVQEQSKAGDCTLSTYPEHRIPQDIAEDLMGRLVCCYHCGIASVVSGKIPPPQKVNLCLVKLPNQIAPGQVWKSKASGQPVRILNIDHLYKLIDYVEFGAEEATKTTYFRFLDDFILAGDDVK